MKAPVQLILRRDAAAMLRISPVTCKKWERSDKDFPKPIALSQTRIAYRADDLARFQSVLQQRTARPAISIADPARARAAVARGVAVRRAKAAKRKAEQEEAETRAKAASAAADVPAAVPAKPKRRAQSATSSATTR